MTFRQPLWALLKPLPSVIFIKIQFNPNIHR